LLFESLVRLRAVAVGFNPEHVVTAQISLPADKYREPWQRENFFTALLRDVEAQPGIAAAGATSYLPMSGANFGFFFFVEGRPHLGVGRDPTIAVRHVSADYFRVMRIPLHRGRTFEDGDGADSQPVAIVNESTARRYFADTDPIGRHLANSRDGLMREIVGVVGDVRFDGPSRDPQDELYLPYRQVPWPSMTLVASSTMAVDAVAGELRRAVARVDRDQAIAEIRPMPSIVAATTAQQQFTGSLLASFALMATVLAAVGLYGVVALFVSQKRHEFGVRLALGAQRTDVVWLVMREGAWTIAAGTAIGLAAALGFGRGLRSVLFGVSASEPSTYAAAALVLAAIGLLACYLPARRATAIAPVDVLRGE
jgi:putative ABC transport system permease protein